MKKLLFFLFGLSILFAFSVNAFAFCDLDISHWAYNDITNMVNKGIITGYADGTFKPDNEITRAEYCVLLAKAKNMTIDYSDSNSHWALPYINAVKKNTWYYEDWYLKEFSPDTIINRGEAALGLRDVHFGYPRSLIFKEDEVALYLKSTFNDYDSFGSFAHTIYDVSTENLMNGYSDGCFHPEKNITRAEMCAILNRAFLNGQTSNNYVASEPVYSSDPISAPFDTLKQMTAATSNIGSCYFKGNFYVGKNSVDGIFLNWAAKNTSYKTIKYLTYTVEFYNAVGDLTIDQITLKTSKTIRLTGPISPQAAFCVKDIVGYSSDCQSVKITDIVIEYMDGTTYYGYYGYKTEIYRPGVAF